MVTKTQEDTPLERCTRNAEVLRALHGEAEKLTLPEEVAQSIDEAVQVHRKAVNAKDFSEDTVAGLEASTKKAQDSFNAFTQKQSKNDRSKPKASEVPESASKAEPTSSAREEQPEESQKSATKANVSEEGQKTSSEAVSSSVDPVRRRALMGATAVAGLSVAGLVTGSVLTVVWGDQLSFASAVSVIGGCTVVGFLLGSIVRSKIAKPAHQ